MVTDDSGATRSNAERILKETAEARVADLDPAVKDVLALNVLEGVFRVAWSHQFDRDRAAVHRELRDVVQVAVAEVVESDAD